MPIDIITVTFSQIDPSLHIIMLHLLISLLHHLYVGETFALCVAQTFLQVQIGWLLRYGAYKLFCTFVVLDNLLSESEKVHLLSTLSITS